MNEVTFHIPGTPVAKGRPRFTRQGRTYTPAKTINYENLVAVCAQGAMNGAIPFSGPLAVEIMAVWPWPKSMSQKKRKLAGAHWKTSRPDTDNIMKAIGDGAENVVWSNDSSIVSIKAKKQYGERPGVTVRVERLGP